MFFIASFTVHIAEFAWVLTHQHDSIFAGCIISFHAIIIFVVGPRVIANLRQTVAVGTDYTSDPYGGKGLKRIKGLERKPQYELRHTQSLIDVNLPRGTRGDGPPSSPAFDVRAIDEEKTIVPIWHSSDGIYSAHEQATSSGTEIMHPFRTADIRSGRPTNQTPHTLSRTESASSRHRPLHGEEVQASSSSHHSKGIKVQRETIYSVN